MLQFMLIPRFCVLRSQCNQPALCKFRVLYANRGLVFNNARSGQAPQGCRGGWMPLLIPSFSYLLSLDLIGIAVCPAILSALFV
jgi:hypothetical protein